VRMTIGGKGLQIKLHFQRRERQGLMFCTFLKCHLRKG
jgi:hypothetical protein